MVNSNMIQWKERVIFFKELCITEIRKKICNSFSLNYLVEVTKWKLNKFEETCSLWKVCSVMCYNLNNNSDKKDNFDFVSVHLWETEVLIRFWLRMMKWMLHYGIRINYLSRRYIFIYPLVVIMHSGRVPSYAGAATGNTNYLRIVVQFTYCGLVFLWQCWCSQYSSNNIKKLYRQIM